MKLFSPSLSISQLIEIIGFVDNHSLPAGIIVNKSDLIIKRNPASKHLKDRLLQQHGIYLPQKTTDLQPTFQLIDLKKKIGKLKPIRKLPALDYLEKEYYLNFNGTSIKVLDRFYHLRHNSESCRVWFQLKELEFV